VPVLLQPVLELFSLPALRQVVAKERKSGLQLWSSQEPGEIVPTLMSVGSIHSPSQLIRQMSKRKGISCVQFYLQKWLLPVGGETALADDEAHNVPNVEFAHGG
jgi:hypothetical protein